MASKKAAAAASRAWASFGALVKPPIAALSACSRCHLVSYCSKPCQVQYWKQKPGGHKHFSATPEERRPLAAHFLQKGMSARLRLNLTAF